MNLQFTSFVPSKPLNVRCDCGAVHKVDPTHLSELMPRITSEGMVLCVPCYKLAQHLKLSFRKARYDRLRTGNPTPEMGSRV